MRKIIVILIVGVLSLVPTLSWSVPPFDLINAVQDLQDRVTELEATVGQLADYVTIETVNGIPYIVFHDVNVQIVNGTGDTYTINGKGNLIIGYNAEYSEISPIVCSDGQYEGQTDCEDNGEVWGLNHKSGSHIIVVGDENRYSRAVGIVAGFRNTINRNHATVTGGELNRASGIDSSVSGGHSNHASGFGSSVSGGANNNASEQYSSVSGGWFNTASGPNGSSVSGGFMNTASGFTSSVSGGQQNTASGQYSSVSGESGWVASGFEEHLP